MVKILGPNRGLEPYNGGLHGGFAQIIVGSWPPDPSIAPACVLRLSVRLSVRPLLKYSEHDMLKTNKPSLMPVSTTGPLGKPRA